MTICQGNSIIKVDGLTIVMGLSAFYLPFG